MSRPKHHLVLLCVSGLLLSGIGIDTLAAEHDAKPASTRADKDTKTNTVSVSSPTESQKGISGGEALFQKLKEGGWTMALLLALSIVMVAAAVERLFVLRQSTIVPRALPAEVMELWRRNRFDEMRERCEDKPSTFSRIVLFLLAHRKADPDRLVEDVQEMGRQEMSVHLQRIRPLSVVSTLAPLLGLFGTVVGMIDCFDTVALMGEMGDASLLAGGISKALVTTASGLIIAIIAIALYHHFRSRTDNYGRILGLATADLLRSCLDIETDESKPVSAPRPVAREEVLAS